jgi:plasmid stabilization system protein ParE
MSVPVELTGKAMSDLAQIAEHIKFHNDVFAARTVVKALLAEAKKLGEDHYHRLGEELDGYDGPPPREVHKWVCLGGRYEIHLEIKPAYAEPPDTIFVLRVWDTRQDR